MESRGMNVFVKVDEYKDILDILGLIQEKIKEAKTILGKINELKNQEDAELELWKNNIADVERKVDFIDQTLFEPKF
jgi:hypothetical protein